MARNGNTDSGIESDHEPECEQTVVLVVDIGLYFDQKVIKNLFLCLCICYIFVMYFY
jgi:hypothetical protein